MSSEWTTSGCTSTEALITIGNTTYIECNCTSFGYIAAFKSDAVITTPVEPTPSNTATATATATAAVTATVIAPTASTPAPSEEIKIQFKFDGDFDKAVQNNGKQAVQDQIKKTIVSLTSIAEDQITSLTISKGSIMVQFSLVPNLNFTTTSTLLAQVEELKTKVNGVFTVTLPDGSNLRSLPNSLVTIDLTTTEAPVDSKNKKSVSYVSIIIIAAVGSLLVMIAITVIFCVKKKMKKDKKVVPNAGHRPSNAWDLEMYPQEKKTVNYGRRNKGKKGCV